MGKGRKAGVPVIVLSCIRNTTLTWLPIRFIVYCSTSANSRVMLSIPAGHR